MRIGRKCGELNQGAVKAEATVALLYKLDWGEPTIVHKTHRFDGQVGDTLRSWIDHQPAKRAAESVGAADRGTSDQFDPVAHLRPASLPGRIPRSGCYLRRGSKRIWTCAVAWLLGRSLPSYPLFSLFWGERLGILDADPDPSRKITLCLNSRRFYANPTAHLLLPHNEGLSVRSSQEFLALCWVDADQEAALPTCAYGHVAVDQKGKAPEHRHLTQSIFAGDNLPNPVAKVLVIGHLRILPRRQLVTTCQSCAVERSCPVVSFHQVTQVGVTGAEDRSPMSANEKAQRPEDLTRLFVERANAKDASGIAELYEVDAVMAYPPGSMTIGRAAIAELWETVLAHGPHFVYEEPLSTLISGDIALTSTAPRDGAGARAQVVRRQSDGSWLRLLDQPEFVTPTS